MNKQKLPATIASVVLVIAIVLLVKLAFLGIDLYRKMDGLIVRQVDGHVMEDMRIQDQVRRTPTNKCERDFLITHDALDFDIVVWCNDHPDDYNGDAANLKK